MSMSDLAVAVDDLAAGTPLTGDQIRLLRVYLDHLETVPVGGAR